MSSTTLPARERQAGRDWAVKLFNKSVLKQRKYKEIVGFLGSTAGLHCLDIGSDNGVISYLLRQRGGSWKSADLDEGSVQSIRELVESEVYQIDGGRTPFEDQEFDRVVIVDFLEHIPDDDAFVVELYRILKPGGELIVNVPNRKESFLRKFRYAIGQTDEKHGHLRPGYSLDELKRLMGGSFSVEEHATYSRFFSELVDTLIVFGLSAVKKGQGEPSQKGGIVTGQDLDKYRSSFKLYSLIYPAVWFLSKLDLLLFFRSGYRLIARAKVLENVHANKGAL